MGNTNESLLDADAKKEALEIVKKHKRTENVLTYRSMYWTPSWKEIEPIVQQMHDDGYKVTYLQYGQEESLIDGDCIGDGEFGLLGPHGQVGWVNFYVEDDLEITYCNAVVWGALGDNHGSHIAFYDKDDNEIWFDG